MNPLTLKAAVSTPLLRREDLHEDPVEQFSVWLDQAARGAVAQPLAAMLATAGADGCPLALHQRIDEGGWEIVPLD